MYSRQRLPPLPRQSDRSDIKACFSVFPERESEIAGDKSDSFSEVSHSRSSQSSLSIPSFKILQICRKLPKHGSPEAPVAATICRNRRRLCSPIGTLTQPPKSPKTQIPA
ncbi:hypothetical protein CsSME_00039078 [Camellia sinensis var. sinensis]